MQSVNEVWPVYVILQKIFGKILQKLWPEKVVSHPFVFAKN